MKKIALFALMGLSLVAVSAQAATNSRVCPFKDHFYISGGFLTHINTDGNLAHEVVTNTHFITSCGDDHVGNNGNVYVVIRNSSGSTCQLTILDGPYEMNPTVKSVFCPYSMQYVGIDHQWGSYEYTLKFN